MADALPDAFTEHSALIIDVQTGGRDGVVSDRIVPGARMPLHGYYFVLPEHNLVRERSESYNWGLANASCEGAIPKEPIHLLVQVLLNDAEIPRGAVA
jgi:hypothetical protein